MKQREFKFKAWYGDVMFQSVLDKLDGMIFIAEDELNEPASRQTWYPANIIFYDKDAIVRQYTGLKDKNGKEIYEGDIVIWEACDCEVRFGFHTVSEQNFIELKAYGFYLYFINMKCYDPIDGTFEGQCEVIGNIYQNNELLKKA